MRPENLTPKTSKKSEIQTVEKLCNSILLFIKSVLFCGLIMMLFLPHVYGQNNTPAQYTGGNKDQVLKGSGRVNQSTLAMEISIPLGNYPGRGINVPISLSYSSKLWYFKMVSQEELTQGVNCYSVYDATFSEKSASGWTTSLDAPYIEYTGWDDSYDKKGFPVGDETCYQNHMQSGDPPSNKADLIKRIMVHLPSGESHEMRVDDAKYEYDRSGSKPSKDGTYYAVDGSNLKYVQTNSTQTTSTGKLLMPDGSFYDFTNGVATKFTDRNGNYTTYNASTDTWTDTLGRPLTAPFEPKVPTTPTTTNNPQLYNIPGLNGGNVTYKLHWKKLDGGTQAESALTDINLPAYDLRYAGDLYGPIGDWDDRHEDPNGPGALFNSQTGTYGRIVDNSGQLFNPVVLTEIELPNGKSYKFSYDVYARIEKITYPTGGTEEFTYNKIPGLSKGNPSDIHGQANFGVSQRTLTDSVSGSFYTWNYSASHVEPKGYKVEIENPDGTEVHRYLHRGDDLNSSAEEGDYGYDDGLAGLVYKTAVFDKNGVPVSQTLTHWTKTSFTVDEEAEADWHPRVTHTENYIYDPNNASNFVWATTKFEYEKEADLNLRETPLLRKRTLQYDYESSSSGASAAPTPDPNEPPIPDPTPVPTPVPSTLLRTAEVTYLINDTVNYPSSADRQKYKDKNMIGLVTESIVKDGLGMVVSKSVTTYDDTTNYPTLSSGSTTNWQTPTEPNYRGNPNTVKVFVDTGQITGSSSFVETHAQFDNFGNQVKAWDAMGNMTETSYSSPPGEDYKFAYPTKVTTPIPDPDPQNNPNGERYGSATAFETEATFDKTTGLPETVTDANGLVTETTYDPTTLRPTLVKTAKGTANEQHTQMIYDDNAKTVTTKTQIDATNWAESTAFYDGLGRTYKSKQVHSDGDIYVEKHFDAEGRVLKVSNPYRTDGSGNAVETKLWTTNFYDDASRVIKVELPGGSDVKTDYGISTTTGLIGTTKQITDQAGKKRKGITDALGRMIRVIEDPTGQNLSTDYVFDTLGNLRETIQGEQHRFFMHDSLGRLLYSKQPEQDANPAFTESDPITNNSQWSNKYVYDNNGNITSTTDARNVTVTAYYDKHNRIIYRDYSDTTPDVKFYYDGEGLATNPGVCAKGQTTRIASSVSETRYTSFDDSCRLDKHEQITQGVTYGSEYTYNLSGAMLTEKYPSGRVMSYEYRADGELDKLSGTRAGQISSFTYLDNISYNTLGNIEKMRLGNGTWETAEYNTRQQVSQIALGSSENTQNLLRIEYEYGDITQNNGSLQKQTINHTGLANEIVQQYTYDDLNRLKSATETPVGSSTPSWKQTFNYDRYGNRTFDATNTTTLSGSSPAKVTNPTINTSDNRITENQDGGAIDYDYDANGNLILDAENKRFVYDAENHIKEFFKGTNTGSTPDATYEYDGDGKRVRKIEETINGQVETIFVYNAGGQLVEEYSNKLAEEPKASYLTADHLGSPRIVTDGIGAVISRHDYMAFGDEVTETIGNVGGRTTTQGYGNEDEIRKGYTGYERDDESGLDFAQARYYNSMHGRFTSVDPLTASANVKNPQTFNRYSYVLNSPYKFIDPLGLVSSNTAACGTWCLNRGGAGEDSVGGIFTGRDLSKGNFLKQLQTQRKVYVFVTDPDRMKKTGAFDYKDKNGEPKTIEGIELVKVPNFEGLSSENVIVYSGNEATIENFQNALKDENAAGVIFIGHGIGSDDGTRYNAFGVNLADGNYTSSNAVKAAEVKAEFVGIFSCDASSIVGLFSNGSNSVTAIDSGDDGYTTLGPIGAAGYAAALALKNGGSSRAANSRASSAFNRAAGPIKTSFKVPGYDKKATETFPSDRRDVGDKIIP